MKLFVLILSLCLMIGSPIQAAPQFTYIPPQQQVYWIPPPEYKWTGQAWVPPEGWQGPTAPWEPPAGWGWTEDWEPPGEF